MATTEEQQPPSVDDTPISPSRPNTQRKNSLEKHLMHRPERQELIDSMFRPAIHVVPRLTSLQRTSSRPPTPLPASRRNRRR